MTKELDSMYNQTVNDSVAKFTDERILLDPKLEGSINQLRKAMVETFEPNKLKSQTKYNAIVLTQLPTILVDDKKKVVVLARIPELHTLLPLPEHPEDFIRMMSYPQFVSEDDVLQDPLTRAPLNSIPPGATVEVSFGNNTNFTEPRLLRIVSILPQFLPPNATGADSTGASMASQDGSGQRPPTIAPQASAQAAGSPTATPNATTVDTAMVGTVNIGAALDAAWQTPYKDGKYQLGYPHSEKKGISTSLCKVVMDDYVSLWKAVTERGGYMTGAGAGRSITGRVKKGGEAAFSFHHIGCAFDLAQTAGTTRSSGRHTAKKGGAFYRYKYKAGKDVPVMAPGKPHIITVDPANPRKWKIWCQVLDPAMVEKYKKQSEGGTNFASSDTDPAFRMLDVVVPAGGNRWTTVKQNVLCFSFTTLAAQNGWDSIGTAKRGATPAKVAAGSVTIKHGLLEWWHFQNAKGLRAGQTFLQALLRIYPEETVKKKWSRQIPYCENGKTKSQKVFLFDLLQEKVKLTASRKAFTAPSKKWLLAQMSEQLGGKTPGKCKSKKT